MDWSSLYIPNVTGKNVHQWLCDWHTAQGYQPYNPFPGGTGTPRAAQELVRVFVSPKKSGWVRVIGEVSSAARTALQAQLGIPFLYVWIDGENGNVETVGNAQLADFLRADKTPADLAHALTTQPTTPPPDNPAVSDLIGQYGVNAGKAEKLVNKTTRSIIKKLSKQDVGQDEAEQALQAVFSWHGAIGQRITNVMACLQVPDTWQNPNPQDLASAYQIACLLDMDEDAPLLPGDEAMLDKVEFPLDYRMVFFAR